MREKRKKQAIFVSFEYFKRLKDIFTMIYFTIFNNVKKKPERNLATLKNLKMSVFSFVVV